MKPRLHVAALAALILGYSSPASAQGPAALRDATHQEPAVTTHATGTFDVKLTPRTPDDGDTSSLGRMTLDKQFHGDLAGTSQGQMLAFLTSTKTSGGYVALERVTGTLHGRKGSFVLQHSGTINRGAQSLLITVVPESGTEELAGLSGTLTIIIEAGKHSYDLEYTIAAP